LETGSRGKVRCLPSPYRVWPMSAAQPGFLYLTQAAEFFLKFLVFAPFETGFFSFPPKRHLSPPSPTPSYVKVLFLLFFSGSFPPPICSFAGPTSLERLTSDMAPPSDFFPTMQWPNSSTDGLSPSEKVGATLDSS